MNEKDEVVAAIESLISALEKTGVPGNKFSGGVFRLVQDFIERQQNDINCLKNELSENTAFILESHKTIEKLESELMQCRKERIHIQRRFADARDVISDVKKKVTPMQVHPDYFGMLNTLMAVENLVLEYNRKNTIDE